VGVLALVLTFSWGQNLALVAKLDQHWEHLVRVWEFPFGSLLQQNLAGDFASFPSDLKK
jgi:hypothetical protein